MRGGYQVTFDGGNRYVNLANYLFSNQGFVNLATTTVRTDGTYFDTQDLPGIVPVTPTALPMQPTPILKQNVSAYGFDSNYQTPYVQNLTLSVTRQVSRNVSVDVRYIGTGMKSSTATCSISIPPTCITTLSCSMRQKDPQWRGCGSVRSDVPGTESQPWPYRMQSRGARLQLAPR